MKTVCEVCGREFEKLSWESSKCYSCRIKSHQSEISEKIKSGEVDSTDCEDEIYCPHCGEIYEIDDSYDLYDEGKHEIECPECGKKFTVDTNVSYSFDTKRSEADHE